ncbi:sugar ABC transporter substrate-binding protein [Lachnoclostridium sp. An118]|uniref:sugar ABC transporter substrate-binding protein n=1 Tax=Lachnoclostridium sp. An118 TaxID=1965547 RepID=UPI000B368039|nr:sugar ABC transporter substrate-binding protein [Lachnoclostridium sp. An118]OUQ52144.1 LacI family transcriptional regulator [Lachnoclostridium sp. An118]
MKNRKFMAVLAMVLVCILSAAGCKKNVGSPEDNPVQEEEEEGEEEGEEDGQADEEGYTFGFSAIDMENPYFITLENSIRESLTENGDRLITMDPGTDEDVQASQIQQMIDEGIDAIFLSPVNWESITPSLETLREAGVRIINVDTQVKEMDYVDAYVGSDNLEAGRICGQALLERCPEGGKVLILECPTQNSINDRITGFEEAISDADPGFEVVARENTDGKFEKSLEVAQAALEAYPDVTAIMCGNDQIAVGAQTAVNLLGMDNVIIYGVDGSPDIKKELLKSDTQIAGTAAQSPINMGKEAVSVALAVLDGGEYEKENYVEIIDMITKDNVEMYGADGWQ